jgi:hypothetical protein
MQLWRSHHPPTRASFRFRSWREMLAHCMLRQIPSFLFNKSLPYHWPSWTGSFSRPSFEAFGTSRRLWFPTVELRHKPQNQGLMHPSAAKILPKHRCCQISFDHFEPQTTQHADGASTSEQVWCQINSVKPLPRISRPRSTPPEQTDWPAATIPEQCIFSGSLTASENKKPLSEKHWNMSSIVQSTDMILF